MDSNWKEKEKKTEKYFEEEANQAMDGIILREEDYMDRYRWKLGCGMRPQRL
jgi:hypothetical protein